MWWIRNKGRRVVLWICASWWKSSGAMMFILLFCYCIHPFAKQYMYVLEWDRRSKIILWYWNQSRNEISMSVILDFMNTAVPNCQGCRRSKGNACWTYILVFQIQLLESSQSLVTILWRSHRLIVHSYIRPETWPLECHQRTNVLPSVSNKLLQEFYLDWCDTCHEPWLPVVPNGKKRHSSSCNADLRVYS